MKDIEKKLNQILNMFNLIHSENIFFMNLISDMIVSDEYKQQMKNYIEKCNNERLAILSGTYEEDVTMLN